MFDDLAAYFYENVVSSYAEYLNVRNNESSGISKDLRAAVVAATALFHLREHVPVPHNMSRLDVTRACPDYGILGDVVNASKHRELNQGKPLLKSAENVYELIVITQYEDEQGPYRDARKLVMVKLIDGSEHDLISALTNVINYWGKEFVKFGILQSFEPFLLPPRAGEQFVNRDNARDVNMEMIREARFKQAFQFLKFDHELGKAKPIDLTGSDVKFRIYKPTYSVNVNIQHPDSEKEYSYTLELTEAETLDLDLLETDEQRQSFLLKLLEERNEELQNLHDEAKEGESNEN